MPTKVVFLDRVAYRPQDRCQRSLPHRRSLQLGRMELTKHPRLEDPQRSWIGNCIHHTRTDCDRWTECSICRIQSVWELPKIWRPRYRSRGSRRLLGQKLSAHRVRRPGAKILGSRYREPNLDACMTHFHMKSSRLLKCWLWMWRRK